MTNYNGYFVPQNMNQQMFQMQQPINPQINNQQPVDERIWVANEQSADAYLVAPNSFVRLWNSNENVFYEKRTDATGRPLPLDIYRYEKIEPKKEVKEQNATVDYQKQISALNGRILALEKAVKKNG